MATSYKAFLKLRSLNVTSVLFCAARNDLSEDSYSSLGLQGTSAPNSLRLALLSQYFSWRYQ